MFIFQSRIHTRLQADLIAYCNRRIVAGRLFGATLLPSETFYSLPVAQRIRLTEEAIRSGEPLMERWSAIGECHSRWSKRAEIAAGLLRDVESVADLGCGGMILEQYLGADQTYVPVDLVTRDHRTIVLNLDRDDIGFVQADACAILGLLEYIHRPKRLLAAVVRQFPRLALSYNLRPRRTTARLAEGWVNGFSKTELYALFTEVDVSVLDEIHVHEAELLFHLRSGRPGR